MAKAARKTVGVIGMEVYGRVALLRSLCVDQAYRGRGIAMMLNAMILSYARGLKIDRLYMFTWYAEKFASKLGFHRIDKKRIPKSIRSAWQFRNLNYYHYPFICMMKKISRSCYTSNPRMLARPPVPMVLRPPLRDPDDIEGNARRIGRDSGHIPFNVPGDKKGKILQVLIPSGTDRF